MFAIISDIHSNIEALTVVLADIEARGIKQIFCLGDIVGYGPNPRECLDLIIDKVQICVLGNHDYGVLYEPTNFNLGAESACFWTRSVLENEPDEKQRNRRWQFIGTQQMRWSKTMQFDSVQAHVDLLHASPRKPINEYIFPDDIYNSPAKIEMLFDRVKHICFVGHTHLPGVFLEDPDFYTPQELGDKYPIVPGEKAIINVGSVGQPRDRDPRASYVFIEGNKVNFVRLDYDYQTTSRKIHEIDQLDNFEGDRLAEGR